ncbi:lipase family alpha/beta hydrolase [Microlunatus flavus]|uniref:AB hydrolase-1 domain-containing protein n=1 Tax=Microlunatus flavus TaxID=1036181 RepID=A0A1H9M0W0_9ACTN|nr:alpha/beta fold hydrolase [Microlunatus flavus]SER17271.1 hypothetical protein SAMN05421756_109204 [Microlunatus flavus]
MARPFDALSPQRRRLVVGLLVGVGALVLALVATTVVRGLTRGGPVPQDQPGPVLLVPGYGGRTASLDPLAAVLRAEGRDVTVVSLLGDGTGDLDAQAAHLADVADDVLRTSGAPSVDVVGYSAGGVVVRLWVRDHGGGEQARRVLTLGSPQHGTSVAALGAQVAGGCPTACEQLLPDSALLRRLNAGDETPAGPEWATVRSGADQVVTPTGSAALAGALNVLVQDVCPTATTSHYALPADPVVAATVRSTLGAGPPAAPATGCG